GRNVAAVCRATGTRRTTPNGGTGATIFRSGYGVLGTRGRAERLNTSDGDDGRRQGAAEELHGLPPGHRRGEDTGNVIEEIVHMFGPGMRGMRRSVGPTIVRDRTS